MENSLRASYRRRQDFWQTSRGTKLQVRREAVQCRGMTGDLFDFFSSVPASLPTAPKASRPAKKAAASAETPSTDAENPPLASAQKEIVEELAVQSREPHVFSVSELTRAVRDVVENQIGAIWVEGEISNFRRQSSGHQYFTLKDAHAQLTCVWFARGGTRLKQVQLTDGMHVQIRGAMTVYETRGQYQLSVQLVQIAGAGLLQAKFEALKRRLDAEGLFDPASKKPLPQFPEHLGIVSSPSGAALRDILNILARRAPWVPVLLSPVRVQGEGAAQEIARAIAELNRPEEYGLPRVDAICVARGGGSIEDLWAFNEEIVARAIAASEIPVISAVGHEIDFTIADFVADLRAPTPSAAAELLVPDAQELARRFAQIRGFLQRRSLSSLAEAKNRLGYLARGPLLREPPARLAEATQQLDLAESALERNLVARLRESGERLQRARSGLEQLRPEQILRWRAREVEVFKARLIELTGKRWRSEAARFQHASSVLRVLGPQATLERGFSIATDAKGEVIRSRASAPIGSEIITQFRDGKTVSVVTRTGA